MSSLVLTPKKQSNTVEMKKDPANKLAVNEATLEKSDAKSYKASEQF